MKIAGVACVLLFGTLGCLAADDSSFQLTNTDTGFCLTLEYGWCSTLMWTAAGQLMDSWRAKCLGAQGKSVGSILSFYDCETTSELQLWECKNVTVLALRGHELYIQLQSSSNAVLSRTTGPNNQLTVTGTTLGACSRTHREYFTIDGNAAGRPCVFPFLYKDRWYGKCTTVDHQDERKWCSVESTFEHELWGYCPSTSKETWHRHITTGEKYQFNTRSALTWSQAESSCRQQGASLLSITDPNQQAYIAGVLGAGGGLQAYKLWTGLTLSLEHGWEWRDWSPFRYLNWDSGHPSFDPSLHCGIINSAVEYTWQTFSCNKRLGYICYSGGHLASPTEVVEAGFCSAPWVPYSGHCFHLFRSEKTWSDAQVACRKEGGDLVSIRNVEDQSFLISQLGYASSDELWIGLNDRRKEGLFDWSDHSTVSFTSWKYGRPSVGREEEDCVLISGENGNWADSVCSGKHGYICMKTSTSAASGEEVEQNIGCRAGWRRHGSYCYFTGSQTKMFDEAKNDCEVSGSYLADVSTGVDNAFLVSLVGLRSEKHFWLGLSNQKNIDYFVWTNNNSVTFTHWNAQMPVFHQGCVAMATGNFAGLWDVLPCTNKEKYICKHLADGATLTSAPPTVPAPQCADGWSELHSRKLCFKVYLDSSIRRSWYGARDYCRAVGGDLLSFHSRLELLLPQRYYKRVWIGLSAPDSTSGFVWSDGSPLNFQDWGKGQPDNQNDVESCVEFRLFAKDYKGSWNDVQCEKLNGWICQITAGVTPNPPPDPVTPDFNKTSDGWLEWNGNQYYINDNDLAMEEAREFCQKRHGDLATINNQAESIFLWNQISLNYGNCWIGLTVDLDGTYQWMDGSQVIFQKWGDGQPDFKHFDENCVTMNTYTGLWHDFNCGMEFCSICKRSPPVDSNTTAEPPAPPNGGCLLPWKRMNSKCYSIINQNLTWDGAKQACKGMGGNLASISSRHMEVFLMSLLADALQSDVWIGLNNRHRDFLWTDGQPTSYVYFAMTEHARRRYEGDWVLDHMWYAKYFGEDYQQIVTCVVMNTNPLFGVGKWIPKSCNETNGFICHREVDPALPDPPQPTSPSYVKILNDSVKFVPEQMNWEAAQRHCEADGSHLVSLRNEWMNAYVELQARNLKAPVWIGLNKKQTQGFFRYVDGWHLTLSHWGRREPSRDKPCVYMDVDGQWKTSHCNETMSSACMKSTEIPPTESSEFPGVCPENPDTVKTGSNFVWIPFRGSCYIFFPELKDWPDASSFCVRNGANLASIEDPCEQEFIHRNVKIFEETHKAFWVGLFKTHKDEWLWLDKTVVDYTNWGDGQPDDDSYGEVTTRNGTWRAGRVWHLRPFICKTSKVKLHRLSPSQQVGLAARPRTHFALAAVIIFAAISLGVVTAYFVCQRIGHRLPIPDKLSTFENPLFFSGGQDQPELVGDSPQGDNEDVNNTGTITTI